MLKRLGLFILLWLTIFSHSLGENIFDLKDVSYSIESNLNEVSKTLSGLEKVSFFTGNRSYKKLYFNIYQHYHPDYFTIDSAWVNDKPVSFSTLDVPDNDLLEIPLEDSLLPHTKVNVILFFTLRFGNNIDDYNAGVKDGNFYCMECFPKLAEFDVEGFQSPLGYSGQSCAQAYGRFADYEFKIKLFPKFKLLANGDLKEIINHPDGSATYSFSSQNRSSILWIADSKRKVLTREIEGSKIHCYYLPKDIQRAEQIIESCSRITSYFCEKFGPSPYPEIKIYLIKLPFQLAGGAKDDVLFFSSGGVLDKIINRESVLPHEISHLWWGGALPGPIWFVEALASFSASLFCSSNPERYEEEGFLTELFEGSYLWYYQLRANLELDSPINDPDVSLIDVYSKGKYIFEMLSDLLGEEILLNILREFYLRYRFTNIEIDDFEKVAEEVSGQDLSWFFDQWFHTNKKIDYGIKSFSSKKEGDGKQKSVGNRVLVSRLGEAIMPVELEVLLKNGEKIIKRLEGKEKIDTVSFISSSRIKSVTLDPERRLLDINRYNNKKPVGLKFNFLNVFDFTFSNDEFYHILLYPSFSYFEDHGWDFGLSLRGKGGIYQGIVLGQEGVARHLTRGSLTYNEHRKALNGFLDYSTPFLRKKGKSFVFGVSPFNSKGKRGAEFYLKRMDYDEPIRFWGVWKLYFQRFDYYPLGYLSDEIWSDGRISLIGLSYTFDAFNRSESVLKGLVANLKGDWAVKTLGGEYSYQKLVCSVQLYKKGFLAWTSAGFLKGSPLFQDRYDLANEGNFKGYPLHQLTSKNLFAGGIEGRFHTPLLIGIFPFVSVGHLPKDNKVYSEGGIGLGIALKQAAPTWQLRIDFPFWLNRPLNGEKQWDLRRWMFRIGRSSSPEQWVQYRR